MRVSSSNDSSKGVADTGSLEKQTIFLLHSFWLLRFSNDVRIICIKIFAVGTTTLIKALIQNTS